VNGAAPVASEVLAEIRRSPKSRIVVDLDTWPSGPRSINVGIFKSADSDGHWFRRRSITLYREDLPELIAAIEKARGVLS
jgi:hypothetical protein